MSVSLLAPEPLHAQPSTLETEVRFKTVEPAHVVYLEFDGRYWDVASRFRDVRAYMLEKNVSGDLFARYPQHPQGQSAGDIHAEVGVIVGSLMTAGQPFIAAQWPRVEVAYVSLSGAQRPSARFFNQLRDAAISQGRVPTDDLVAIYHGNRSGGGPVTELQLRLEPGQQRTTKPATDDQKPERPVLDPEVARNTSSIELLRDGRGKELAAAIAPQRDNLEEWEIVWLEHIQFRIGAAGKALNDSYPGKGDGLGTVAAELRSHLRSISETMPPPSQHVVRVPRTDARWPASAQAVLDQFDAFVGRLAMNLLTPEEALESGGHLLDLARTVLSEPEGP